MTKTERVLMYYILLLSFSGELTNSTDNSDNETHESCTTCTGISDCLSKKQSVVHPHLQTAPQINMDILVRYSCVIFLMLKQ